MNLNAFLYRRLSRWITCELRLPFNSKIGLHSKYEVASFNDVFCHPFYWQMFQYLEKQPQLIVDCGAHCGHFTILAEICIRTKFSAVNTEYILVEPNPFLIPIIEKNLKDANLYERASIKECLIGSKSGQDTLWVNKKNYLTASLQPQKNSNAYQVNYIDLLEFVGERTIDLMKIDIEGGEYDFVPANLRLLSQTNLVFIEIHSATEEMYEKLYKNLESVGLQASEKPIYNENHQLLIFQRSYSSKEINT
ncbi:FkbM family methyltransferase [Aphanizomenon sp. PH219]|nr:FkbM family methyltransferase [Aphanizomenon sp. 202]MDK2459804.1 FkbM family methyltransferase [Aphanizomenon sp. PH219]